MVLDYDNNSRLAASRDAAWLFPMKEITMKQKIIYILLFCFVFLSYSNVAAQTFRNTLLLEALQTVNRGQSDYTIDILSDGLKDLTISAKVTGLSVPEAVKRVCKGQPVKVKIHGRKITVQYDKKKEVRKLKLYGKVQDIRAHKDLIGATVELLDGDSTVLQTKVAKCHHWAENYDWETSEFNFIVPALPAKYIFRISFVGHRTAYVDYKVERIGRREHERALPPFYLSPQTTMLQEVKVTASKVKFYYKGDTLIYNADAFILAEGSMLDALIKQLPGVELKRDGRIYHEGKFVDDLLLNGKQFFSHDSKLLLENLPAYTVKDIAIYDKQTAENEFLGRKDERTQRHVIDVRLKKEYMIGWLMNAEVGVGNSLTPAPSPKGEGSGYRPKQKDYILPSPFGEGAGMRLFRLFAMRHTDFSRFAVVANANNLDDDSRPGDNDNWQRGKTNDLRRTERADIDFGVSDRQKRWELYGNASVVHSTTDGETTTTRQNFLPTGDTYDYSFDSKHNEDLRLSTWMTFVRNTKQVRWTIDPKVTYHRFDHNNEFASATFNASVANVSRQLLDELYSPSAQRINLRDTLVNRILCEGSGNGHDWSSQLNLGAVVKIPHSNESLRLGATISYDDRDEQLFNKQSLTPDPSPKGEGRSYNQQSYSLPSPLGEGSGVRLHQYYDNHPDRNLLANIHVGYNIPLGPGWRSLYTTYYFNHIHRHRKSSLYLLSKLGSSLPSVSEYEQVMDANNSFNSCETENLHRLDINLGYKFNKASYGQIWTLLDGNINFRQQHLDYQRGSIDTTLHRNAFEMYMQDMTVYDIKGGHQVSVGMSFRVKQPNLENRINLRDDTDPMNIRLGNPNLRSAITPNVQVMFFYNKKRIRHHFEWDHDRTYNAIAMGYVYDTQTGVRTFRPDNVDGNWNMNASYTLRCTLDTAQKLNLDLPIKLNYSHSADFIGVATSSVPFATALSQLELSIVRRQAISLSPTFRADIGKHHFELTCQPVWDRLSSKRSDFENINAFTCRTAFSAILKLPLKFDLSTDVTLYSRRGYADAQMNTDNLVWNARLTRPFLKGRLLLILDGFDILGQLDNVTRVVNAQGRTETYTNVMPRYALFHAVYRLNKRPKKK